MLRWHTAILTFGRATRADCRLMTAVSIWFSACLLLNKWRQSATQLWLKSREVSARWAVMIEPFTDFNRDPLRRACTEAKGYFSLGTRDLKRFGLEPVFVFDDIPQKITRGAGLVVAKKL